MSGLAEKLKQSKAFENKAHEAMLCLIVAAVQVRERIERVCKSQGLTFTHYNVLRILKGGPAAGYPRAEIVERMLDPYPDVTRLIDTLVARGLVRRTRCEKDRRVARHWITEEGILLLRLMQDEINGVHETFGERFSEKELETLTSLCERIFETVADVVDENSGSGSAIPV